MTTSARARCWLLISVALLFASRAQAGEHDAVRVQLPRDDGSHRSLLEWWYWTGELKTAQGRRFGFHLVFFELRPLGVAFQITHHALTDVQEKSFQFRIERGKKIHPCSGPGFDLRHGDLRALGGGGRDRLQGRVGKYRLELDLVSQKPPVPHHDRGFIHYDFGGHSYYYSRTRMKARGTLYLGEKEWPVTGSVWFDHQWGDMGEVFEQSWDWFGIQLDDGREIMAFRMRVGGEEKLRGGSLVQADGSTHRLRADEVEIVPEGSWKSPHSGCEYPRRWRLQVRNLELSLTPVVDDQEIWSHFPRYWEGLADVSGSASGRAFVELSNYCR